MSEKSPQRPIDRLPDTPRQLYLLVVNFADWRTIFLNRLMITLLIVLAFSGTAYAYVDMNNDGYVEGVVVDKNGEPVENATVEIGRIDLKGVVHDQTVTTDENGRFQYQDPELLEYRLVAYHEDIGRSDADTHHLLYKGQNREHRLVLEPENGE